MLGKPHRYAIWPRGRRRATPTRGASSRTRRRSSRREAQLFGGALPYDPTSCCCTCRPGRAAASSTAPAPRSSRRPRASRRATATWTCCRSSRTRSSTPGTSSASGPRRSRPTATSEECYTRLLWWFEGATSYYDWRVLALRGSARSTSTSTTSPPRSRYLDADAGAPRARAQDTSFDAWIKLYRPDENSREQHASATTARASSCARCSTWRSARADGGRATLDGVLAHLWSEHGARRAARARRTRCRRSSSGSAGVPLGDLFDAWIRSAAEIDSRRRSRTSGSRSSASRARTGRRCSLGVRLQGRGRPGGGLLGDAGLVRRGAPASIRATRSWASAAPAWRAATSRRCSRPARPATRSTCSSPATASCRPGASRSTPARPDKAKLVARKDASASARAAFEAWLGASHAAWAAEVK